MHQSTSKGIIHKALAILGIMQCLIGFSKRGCCHDNCDVEVVVYNSPFVGVPLAGSPPPALTPFRSPCRRPRSLGPIVSYSTKRHARQESTQRSKRRQDVGKSNNTGEAIRDTRLSPLDGCPISSGQRITSGGMLSTGLSHGQASMAL